MFHLRKAPIVFGPKSLYRSRAGRHFLEQNMRFGLVLGQLAILQKTWGANYEQLLRVVFSCFQGQKNDFIFLKNIVVEVEG